MTEREANFRQVVKTTRATDEPMPGETIETYGDARRNAILWADQEIERLHYALRVLLASRLRMPIADIHESDVDDYCNSIVTIVKAAERRDGKL